MKIFISGGAKNGKSTLAETLAVSMQKESKPAVAAEAGDQAPLYYIATMVPTDEEDQARIQRHRESRQGKGFITIERSRYLTELLGSKSAEAAAESRSTAADGATVPTAVNPAGTFLVDSVTALLSNVMFPLDGNFDEEAGEKVAEDLIAFGEAAGNVIFVSDYIYSEAKIFDQWTEKYRKALAFVDRRLAEAADQVIEVTAAIPIWHKGNPEL